MANKHNFITRARDTIVQMAIMHESITGLSGVYTDRGHFPGGEDPITDQDLIDAGVPMTAVQFNTNVIGVLGDYLSFANGTALPAFARKSKMNKARGDM